MFEHVPVYDTNRLTTKYRIHEIADGVRQMLLDGEVRIPEWSRNGQRDELNALHAQVLRAIRQNGFLIDEHDRQAVGWEVTKRIVGLGILHPFLEEEDVEEIIVRNGFVQTEREGQIQDEGFLAEDAYFEHLAHRVAETGGKSLNPRVPQVKLGLPDGSRFTATIPPLSHEGTAINIRRFARKTMTFDDLLTRNSCDEETIDFLTRASHNMSHSVLFSGRPGAGKTTWLNAFSKHLPVYAQLSIVETFHELQPLIPHKQHLVVEDEPEEMAQIINTVILRMRPDLIMIGEVVSREAEQYIKALNLGIRSMSTTHAQNARLALTRLEVLSGQSDMNLEQRRQIIGAGDLIVVHLTKEYDERERRYRRYMQEILAVRGYQSGDYVLQTLKRFDRDHYTPLEGVEYA
jgi:pilus assembly protein CpaF